jgi:2-isopropylmalate synthase
MEPAVEKPQITIFDTTLRDGEQSPGCSMNVEEKLRMAQQLERLGVDVIEAGFPIASEGDFQAVRLVAKSVRRPTIAALARCTSPDVERAAQALEAAANPRIHVFLATSDIHLTAKLKMSREQCVAAAAESVRLARVHCDDVEFSPEDATRTDLDFLCQVVQAVIDEGATTVNIPDTVGYTMPEEYGHIIRTLRERVRGIENVIISTHCHNDLGMAVANSLAAIGAGARQIECTINGIGERAGNAALEEVVMAMRVRPDRYPFTTAIVGEEIFPTSQLLSEITHVACAAEQGDHGTQCFRPRGRHSSARHVAEPADVRDYGRRIRWGSRFRLVLGKHSGRHASGGALQRWATPSTAAISTKSTAALSSWPTGSSWLRITTCCR